MATAYTSPGKVIGLPTTPPRRTSWIPTSPSPLRNSFTKNSGMTSNDDTDEDDEELLRLKLEQIEARIALAAAKRKRKERKSQTMVAIQVPQSPEPPPPAPVVPTSPQRVLLGIDRGKKASDVSLKNPFKQKSPTSKTPPKGPSFATRMAELAQETKRKAEIEEDKSRTKSKSFSATAIASQLTKQPETQNGEEWCKYTGFNLRTRCLTQSVLREEFKGKTTYSVSDLYRLVTPPNYYAPEYDTPDFLVTGIVASKSPVRQVKGREDGGNYLVVTITDLKMDIDLFLFGAAFTDTWKLQKGMVVVLLNPQIFKRKDGKGFNLRMTENKTPLQRNQRTSDLEGGESVLEVGFSRDWGSCEAMKSDGTTCSEWVDTRHTKICEYHVDQGLKRARKGRMEYAVGIRPLSPKKEKETRNPFGPRKQNTKEPAPKKKRTRTNEPDRWDGGGGSVYTSTTTTITVNPIEADPAFQTKKRIEGIKRELKGTEKDRELRRVFKSFAPARPAPKPQVDEKTPPPVEELGESKAFDAKRLRGIGFDPRRRANEEVRVPADRKIAPIVGGQKISLEGVLGGMPTTNGDVEMDSDSDSDLDIVME